ncbi:hypothetical protein [Corynebacterium aquilae]|uniref:DUF1980 domain-containing protein n=1 Tax=Corynebacterium aquilae DSM 44791 TaxID=1431546 RepID=A0A1L7CI87_9CORY|nr:hypothetical protein [Corynebacterium aquilae]APT85567.1 hypothetical protein CAQU_11510 [Corynebacterium aquilae DSM 44791]
MRLPSADALLLLVIGCTLGALWATGAVYNYVRPSYASAVLVAAIVVVCAAVWQWWKGSVRADANNWVVMLVLVPTALLAFVGARPLQPTGPGEDMRGFLELAQDDSGQQSLVGQHVDLVGQVWPTPDDEYTPWTLVRYRMICCAADAVPYGIRVASPPPQDGQWVRVEGTVVENPLRIVDARVVPVKAPERPYL